MNTCVILLNWNGWNHTIECLESVFRLMGADYSVIVCDNDSTDGSLEQIKRWARGELIAGCKNSDLEHLVSPPVPKPIRYRELTRREAESLASHERWPLTLIENGANLGFAGGCNVALRLALSDPECEFFWLLNNDTVVEPEALAMLIESMHQQPRLGLCGSLLLSYYAPKQVRVAGGRRYSRWTSRVHSAPACSVKAAQRTYPTRIDFVDGASMLASRKFLETVGLMNEMYFLYFEELDWAARAHEKHRIDYTPFSIVYHKEGATLGTSPGSIKHSLLAEKYIARNRIGFTRLYYPWALPTAVMATSLAAAFHFLRGDFKRAGTTLRFMLRGLIGAFGAINDTPDQLNT